MNDYDRQFQENSAAIVRGGKTVNKSVDRGSKRQIDRKRKRAGKRTLDEAYDKIWNVFGITTKKEEDIDDV